MKRKLGMTPAKINPYPLPPQDWRQGIVSQRAVDTQVYFLGRGEDCFFGEAGDFRFQQADSTFFMAGY